MQGGIAENSSNLCLNAYLVLQIHFYIQNAMKADFLEDKISIGDLAEHEMPVLNHLPAHATICCLKVTLSKCGDVC